MIDQVLLDAAKGELSKWAHVYLLHSVVLIALQVSHQLLLLIA